MKLWIADFSPYISQLSPRAEYIYMYACMCRGMCVYVYNLCQLTCNVLFTWQTLITEYSENGIVNAE